MNGRNPLGTTEDRAVSPVIGVILMVAITVILAAVIAAFVLGIGPGGDTVSGSVDVSGDGTDSLTLSVSDGGSADQVVLADGSTIVWADNAGTGDSYDISHSDLSDVDDSDEDFTVWLLTGDVSEGSSLDSADGTLEIRSVTLEASNGNG